MKKITYIVFFLIITPLFLISAHSDETSLEKQIGETTIDIGYDTDPIASGQPVRFDFSLWNNSKTTPVDFSVVWVKISSSDGSIPFSGYVGAPNFGSSNISYIFAYGGSYEITARFEKGEDILAEASFPLTVTGASATGNSTRNIALSGAIGFLLGGISIFFFRKRGQENV
jgi:hypothetical protein